MIFDLEKVPLLLYMGTEPVSPETIPVPDPERRRYYGLQEIQVTGESQIDHFGVGACGTLPAARMEFEKYTQEENDLGRLLVIESRDPVSGLHAAMHFQFLNGLPVFRCWNVLTNFGTGPLGLEVVSTFVHAGIADEQKEDLRLLVPHNSWQQELQWRELPVFDLGFRCMTENGLTGKRLQYRSIGSWSTGEYLPMGCLRNVTKGTMEFWQIEHNGPWNWEFQARDGKLSLVVNGPDDANHHWWKCLNPGERFETVKAAVGCINGGIDEAFGALTKYRRIIRRENQDNLTLPIIFNDYMNCLWGDPTTEKELPIIDAAAELGCEYYCIDAGWYTDENWWFRVGDWEPSEKRFPGGLREVTDYIRSKNMIPGIWIEIESVGTQSDLARTADKSWFLQRHGVPSIDRERYHLDFRNPDVRKYTRGKIDRLIREFGIGYFKIDYNINAFMGTDYQSDSMGDGLLEHNRAYLAWLDEIFHDYPDVIIENCGSGGMRMDYAMLSRLSIQSTSDQTDYLRYASIAANVPTGVTPEQAAIWSYPLETSDREAVIFNCVNACLFRIHQSGHLGKLKSEHKDLMDLIKEAYAFYRENRKKTPVSLPFWPLGLAKDKDAWMAVGLRPEDKEDNLNNREYRKNRDNNRDSNRDNRDNRDKIDNKRDNEGIADNTEAALLAVWRLDGEESCRLPLPLFAGMDLEISTAFPANDDRCDTSWDRQDGILTVSLKRKNMARILKLRAYQKQAEA